MLMIFVGVVLICAFPLAKEADDSLRLEVTLERIEEIRRALFGRIVEVREFPCCIRPLPGAGSCFFSEVGMPTDSTGGTWHPLSGLIENHPYKNVLYTLMRGQDISYPSPFGSCMGPGYTGGYAVPKWHWNRDKKYWAGYRGGHYIMPPPGETDEDGNPVFNDGHGEPLIFFYTSCAHWYNISTTGVHRREYEHFESDHGFIIEVTNRSGTPKTLDVGIVYPLFGQVILRYSLSWPQYIPVNETAEFRMGGFQVYPATGPVSTMKVITCEKREDGRYRTLQTGTATWNANGVVIEIDYKGYGEEG